MSEESFREHGFAGRLHKPFTVQELLEVLKRAPVGKCLHLLHPLRAVKTVADGLTLTLCWPFSADDAEAALSIIDSFITETRKESGVADRRADCRCRQR